MCVWANLSPGGDKDICVCNMYVCAPRVHMSLLHLSISRQRLKSFGFFQMTR